MLKQLGKRLLTFYCHPDFQEDIIGDLEEYYFFNLEERGQKYASRKYLIDVILLFRVSLLRENWFSQKLTNIAMVQNNLKVAYRSMMRHKFYSFLNLTGLAVSIAACLLIAIYVQDELSYDRYHKDSDRIYRIASYLKFGNNEFRIPASPDPMAETLKNDYPEVEEAARLRGDFSSILEFDNKFFTQPHITYADQSIFNILTFGLIQGNHEHLLDEPNTAVLTASVARKIFGDTDPIGQTIQMDGRLDIKVTGVIQDVPDNSHFRPEVILTMLNDPSATRGNWLSNNHITYLKLSEANDPDALYAKFPSFVVTHFSAMIKQFTGNTLEELIRSGSLLDYQLQPIERIHLYTQADYGFASEGSIQYVYIFSIIGFFILLIACINFMNLATARASIRAKEVGVRKVLGSLRKQLINQFLTESLLSSSIAFTLAIGLIYLVLPAFNMLTDKAIINPIFSTTGLWPYVIVASLVIGLAAGIYPAFFLSSFRPVQVLKGEITKGKSGVMMRNILVIVQFTTSISLIIGSLIVYSQLSYMQNMDLGFNKDQVLTINETSLLGPNLDAYKNQLQAVPGVEAVSISGYIPTGSFVNDFPVLRNDATTSEEAVSVQNWVVDHNYAKTYDLEIIAGNFFSPDRVSDSSAVILNETAIKRFGYTDDPIGKKMRHMSGLSGTTAPVYTIIGVVKDFHFGNINDIVLPQGLYLGNSPEAISIKFSPEQAKAVLSKAEQSWDELTAGQPFDYDYMDDRFHRQFESQARFKTIFTVFAVLAVIIAGLGLFGLSAYVTEQRKKELGIRKVLGASRSSLLKMLFSNFNKLILVSAVLATSIAWYFMNDWLSGFSYRIKMTPLVFVLGALATFIIAWLTVGFQSLKATHRNPVDNLRTE